METSPGGVSASLPAFETSRVAPFDRRGLTQRIGPFALVSLLAEASLALPPGPTSTNYTILSIALLAAAALAVFLPWNRLPRMFDVIVPLLYIGSVLTLVLAAGGSTSGIGIVILIPLIWTSLYHRPAQSALVVLGVLAYETVTAVIPVRVADAVLARRLLFWIALATLLSYATHELRVDLQRLLDQRKQLVGDLGHSVAELETRERQSRILSELGEMLPACTTTTEAYEVIRHGVTLLFPAGGALSIFNSSRNLLETVVTWGPQQEHEAIFQPSACLALRRGRVHASGDGGISCAHVRSQGNVRSICVPMIAQGDTVGVLQFLEPRSDTQDGVSGLIDGDARQLALTTSEYIALSVANFRLRETLRNQSIRDPLTNLFNRRYMEETFERELARASRTNQEIGIAQIDVDHFKGFNDAHGHHAGDAILRALGELLLREFRELDVPCRYGGEEFTLILPHSSLAQTEERMNELQQKLAGLQISTLGAFQDLPDSPPTLSIGIASYPAHGKTSEALIRAADQALYAAKKAGRNRVVLAESRVHAT